MSLNGSPTMSFELSFSTAVKRGYTNYPKPRAPAHDSCNKSNSPHLDCYDCYPFSTNTTDTMNVAVEHTLSNDKDVVENIDIMFSIVGGAKPPTLPLRGEFLSQGIELVYNAKGVGDKVVCKEQKRREALLLEKLKKIERKIENKKSYKRSAKKEKALATVRDLRQKLENSAKGISYEMYLAELRRLQRLKRSRKKRAPAMPLRKSSAAENALNNQVDGDKINTNSHGSSSRSPSSVQEFSGIKHIETQLLEALDLLDDSASFLHFSDADSSLDFSNDTRDDSMVSEGTATTLEITDQSLETSPGDPSSNVKILPASIFKRDSKIEGEESDEGGRSALLNKGGDSSRTNTSAQTQLTVATTTTTRTSRTTASATTALFDNTTKKTLDDPNKPVFRSSSSSNVRFVDVKPTTGDHLARARALIENARIIQRNFSADSNSSSIVASDSYDNKRAAMVIDKAYCPSKGRYHLFVSHACPWSHRTLVVRALKGLENTISVSFLDCRWDPQQLWDTDAVLDPDKDVGFWSIDRSQTESKDETHKVFIKVHLDQLHPKTALRVPILWDKIAKKVVSKSSAEIMRMLNFDFNKWAKRPKLNLYPPAKKLETVETNKWLHDSILIPVYRCGLANSQCKYDEAINTLTKALDKTSELVTKRGFLIGDKLTESDIRLFVTLIRFDEIYRVLFKTNTRRIATSPGLLEYVRDIYNVQGMREVCDVSTMKKEYFGAKAKADYIIPRGGLFIELLNMNPPTA